MPYRAITQRYFEGRTPPTDSPLTVYTTTRQPVKIGKMKNAHFRRVFYVRTNDRIFRCDSKNDVCKCLSREFGIKKYESFINLPDLESYLATSVVAKEFGIMTYMDMHDMARQKGYRCATKWMWWGDDKVHRGVQVEDYCFDNENLFLVIDGVAIGPLPSMEARFNAFEVLKGCIDIYYGKVTHDSMCVTCPHRNGCQHLKEFGQRLADLKCERYPVAWIKNWQAQAKWWHPHWQTTWEAAQNLMERDSNPEVGTNLDYRESDYQQEPASAVACNGCNHFIRVQ